MDKMVKRGRLKSQGPDVRGGARIYGAVCPEPSRFGAPGAGCLSGDPDVRPDDFRSRLGRKFSNWGRKFMIPRAKLMRFRGWKVGKLGDMLDPLETKQIY